MASPFGAGGPDFVRATLKSHRVNIFVGGYDGEYDFTPHFWLRVPRNDPLMTPSATRHASEALRRKVVCALSGREHEATEWHLMAGWLRFHFGVTQEGETDE